MAIQVDVYTAQGVARGVVARSGYLRDVLEAGGDLRVERATWQSLDDRTSAPAGDISIAVDDIVLAVGDDEPNIPVHASWHMLRIVASPYALAGEMPTLPGYDPGRALARPTGEFVLLRDVCLAVGDDPTLARPLAPVALVNRYVVERISADLMLGFYFPGAVMEQVDEIVAV